MKKVRTPFGPDHVRDMTDEEYKSLKNQGVPLKEVPSRKPAAPAAPKPPVSSPELQRDRVGDKGKDNNE